MKTARGLSKSRLVASLQCQRRLWLATYQPELAEVSEQAQRIFGIGHGIGDLARQLYGNGTLIDALDGDFGPALDETQCRLRDGEGFPLYEATFQHDGLLVRLDVLRETENCTNLEVAEVKSSTDIKDHQLPDAAIQAWVMEQAGFAPKRVSLAIVDNSFVYPGNGDYRGLLREVDITKEVRPFLI